MKKDCIGNFKYLGNDCEGKKILHKRLGIEKKDSKDDKIDCESKFFKKKLSKKLILWNRLTQEQKVLFLLFKLNYSYLF